MRFPLDENVEYRVAMFLATAVHDATAIAVDHTRSLADREVLRIAATEGRILLTSDRDFGELIVNQRLPHAGVIYFRLRLGSTAEDKIGRLQDVLAAHAHELGQFLVVGPRSVRVRRGD